MGKRKPPQKPPRKPPPETPPIYRSFSSPVPQPPHTSWVYVTKEEVRKSNGLLNEYHLGHFIARYDDPLDADNPFCNCIQIRKDLSRGPKKNRYWFSITLFFGPECGECRTGQTHSLIGQCRYGTPQEAMDVALLVLRNFAAHTLLIAQTLLQTADAKALVKASRAQHAKARHV